ncbi:unnamed protein product [Rhizopus microsporus]
MTIVELLYDLRASIKDSLVASITLFKVNHKLLINLSRSGLKYFWCFFFGFLVLIESCQLILSVVLV